MSFWHNMNHRPHHNLTQMSHWIKTDNRNCNSTKHCCHQVPWKDKSFWIHFKPNFLCCHLKTCSAQCTIHQREKIQFHLGPMPLLLAHLHSCGTRVSLYPVKWYVWKTWFEFSSNPHDIGAAIAAWICLTIMQMSFSWSLFTDKDNLPFFV